MSKSTIPDPDTLVFGELPEKMLLGRPPNPAVDRIVDALKARPGEWALITEMSKRSAGYGAPYRKRGCLVASRKLANGNFGMFASWPAADNGTKP